MRFKVFPVFLLLAGFLLINCGFFSKPSDTVKELSTRIKNQNIENLEELFSENVKSKHGDDFFERFKKSIQDKKFLDENPQLISYEIDSEEIISDRALVITKSISEEGRIEKILYVLLKENDGWKIDNIDSNPG